MKKQNLGTVSKIWRAFDSYMWLGNHNYFYICAVHEYCFLGTRCRKRVCGHSEVRMVIAVRALLFLAMVSLIIVEIPVERAFRWQYLTNWGIYITFLSTLLNLLCALWHRKCAYKWDTLKQEIRGRREPTEEGGETSEEDNILKKGRGGTRVK